MKFDYSKILDSISKKGREKLFLLLGVIGAFFIFLGDTDICNSKTEAASANLSLQQYKRQMEDEITALLKEIDGVGDVKVMITLESGEENIYAQQEKTAEDVQKQSKDNSSQETSQTTFENEIVIISQSGANTALVEKTVQPIVQGVAVVCSGADDVKVVSNVTNTVSVVLGVATHKIFVTKMR